MICLHEPDRQNYESRNGKNTKTNEFVTRLEVWGKEAHAQGGQDQRMENEE